ncbi:MAG: acyltransferase [Spirochaetales bacterium]|jgi:acetyltransferase-like isoleucine patch superfamily enzyme|nr:acyltransferase [Spirochaetales bacterium]
MKKLALSIAYSLVRLIRKIRGRIKLYDLKLRGVIIDSTASVDPAAIFEPSGGKIIIGPNSVIDRGVILRTLDGTIEIGSDCSINAYSVVYGSGGLRIGNGVRIAPHTVIVPSNHIFSDPDVLIKDQSLSLKGIVIEDDVWIGTGARVLDGVVIKQGTVVGAGAVVTKSTEPYSIVVGVPAKKIATRLG